MAVRFLPRPPQAGFGATSTSGSRADPRERGPPCGGVDEKYCEIPASEAKQTNILFRWIEREISRV